MISKDDLNSMIELAEKEKDISAKMSNEQLLFILVKKFNCESDVFKEIFPFAIG